LSTPRSLCWTRPIGKNPLRHTATPAGPLGVPTVGEDSQRDFTPPEVSHERLREARSYPRWAFDQIGAALPPPQDGFLSFKAFLSHRYKSPAVNRYFFRIFADTAEVQFEVDEGAYAINVTRLERMIRDCDAFIGIYPFSGRDAVPQREDLLYESRYFRLELDLAIRAQKPGLILHDRRYGQLFKCPPLISSLEFDSLEVESPGGSPSAGIYRRAFRTFCERVAAWKEYDVTARAGGSLVEGVALLMPTGGRGADRYSTREIDLIRSVLSSRGYDNVRMVPWPPILDAETLTHLRQSDWAVTDVAQLNQALAVAAYLHGSFVPTMRLARASEESAAGRTVDFLYGGVEVGYVEDIIRWSGRRSLEQGLQQRLSSLHVPVRRVSTTADADEYFRSASLRKETVFLSYAGRDEQAAQALVASLRETFQRVFDYRDGESIRAGQPWLEEIFTQLSASAIGIPLLSTSYVESGNCLHELREMVAQRDSKKMEMVSVVLEEGVEIPAYVRDLQYLPRWKYDGAQEVIEAIVKALP